MFIAVETQYSSNLVTLMYQPLSNLRMSLNYVCIIFQGKLMGA